MSAMRMVQVSGDEVVNVIAVRNRFMATINAVNVVRRVPLTDMAHRAIVRVRLIDGDPVLIVMIPVMAMEVSVVQVVDVVVVPNGSVTAPRSVDVNMVAIGVDRM